MIPWLVLNQLKCQSLIPSIKNSDEVLSKLKCRGFRATSLSTYDFSSLYTFRNLLGSLESAIMLQTSTLEINV